MSGTVWMCSGEGCEFLDDFGAALREAEGMASNRREHRAAPQLHQSLAAIDGRPDTTWPCSALLSSMNATGGTPRPASSSREPRARHRRRRR
jgi:hypothetical protein